MSEKNNIFENDLLMRSILEGGQEEVPSRVWDAVSQELDKAAAIKGSRRVALWWRRAGIGAAAAAAVVAGVLMIDRQEPIDIVPTADHKDMIAVVEPQADAEAEEVSTLTAYAPEAVTPTFSRKAVETERTAEMTETGEVAVEMKEPVIEEAQAAMNDETEAATEKAQPQEYFPVDWDEEDGPSRRKVGKSLVVSGLTGTSGSQTREASGPLKAPAVILAPSQTGIKEKNSEARYGLPISVGAGVRFELSQNWSIGVGLNYTCLTRTFNGTYTHVNEAGNIDNLITSDIRNSQHYLGIPVNAYYSLVNSKNVKFYTYAGGAVEKCIYDKYLVLTNTITHKEPSEGVQVSANLGLGAEFMLGQHIGLYIDPSLRYYFDCGQPKSIRTVQPLLLGVELGLRFDI